MSEEITPNEVVENVEEVESTEAPVAEDIAE